jgi:hypothetical protein
MCNSRGGRKLSLAGQQLVKERLIAGDSCKEIRQALVNAGHESITDESIWIYRQKPDVIEAFASKEAQVIQIGFAVRGARLDALHMQAREIQSRMYAADKDDAAVAMLARSFNETIDRIEKLAGPLETTLKLVGHDGGTVKVESVGDPIGIALAAMKELNADFREQIAGRLAAGDGGIGIAPADTDSGEVRVETAGNGDSSSVHSET